MFFMVLCCEKNVLIVTNTGGYSHDKVLERHLWLLAFLYFSGMGKLGRVFLWILLVMNCLVLLGQVWPQGAPPFAGTVNLVFHVLTFVVLVSLLFGRKGR